MFLLWVIKALFGPRLWLLGGFLSLGWGCGASFTSAPVATVASGPITLGKVDGKVVTEASLPDELRHRLQEAQNEAMQRRLHLMWMGFEEAVADALLAKEAKRRGISVERLREDEIYAKTTPPSEEEVASFYEQNKATIGVPLEAAAQLIKTEMRRERVQVEERALLEKLRQGARIEYSIPLPELPRSPMETDGITQGPKNAKVTLVTFSDFECPFCARARLVVARLRSLYPEDLRVVFKDFPLAQHGNARKAAEAAQCADEQSKFWPYHDALFDNQNALSSDDLSRYAREVGLDLQSFASCLASGRPGAKVSAGEASGRRMGVTGTPAIYINGMKLIGLLPLPLLQSLIDRELGR